MFNDASSKRIIILAHCLLNQNSISDGTADCPSQFAGVVDLIMAIEVDDRSEGNEDRPLRDAVEEEAQPDAHGLGSAL